MMVTILFPLASFDPVRKVAASETVHGMGSQLRHRLKWILLVTMPAILLMVSSVTGQVRGALTIS